MSQNDLLWMGEMSDRFQLAARRKGAIAIRSPVHPDALATGSRSYTNKVCLRRLQEYQ
ncbi:MAG TPA: hypothetical protein V6C95_09115 [Coleofasciculaceae cyanobacterium]